MDNKNNFSRENMENKENGRLRKQINNFLIYYFNYFVLAVSLIVFAAGLFFFVYPQYEKMAQDREKTSKSLQAEYESKSGELAKIDSLMKSYQLIAGTDKKKIAEMVPAESEVTRLISEVDSIVLKNGAVLNSIKIDSGNDQSQAPISADSSAKGEAPEGIFKGQLPQGVGMVRLEINLSSANYQVLKNIIKAFENNIKLFDIAQIDYSVADDKVALVVYTYYLMN
ncbi:MAG: hypothetical protein PHS62_01950 [Patescibacteria group bacterium]|nr:hypothetical protein [Patescibacteria group bacterium]